MTNVAFTLSDKTVTVFAGGSLYPMDSTHPNFESLIEELKKPVHDVEKIISMASIKNFIEGLSFGNVIVAEDNVYYKNKPIDGYLAGKMITLFKEGFDITMWMRFVDNLMLNPVESARKELYLFLEKSGIPLTDDGCFLAFKKVRDDYRSYHTPKNERFDHRVGNRIEEDDEKVDRDRNATCSSGLHFCSFDYLSRYYGGKGRVVVVKINPADVRAIPHDYNNAKGRAIGYDVVGEVTEDGAATAFPHAVETGFHTEEEDDTQNGSDYEDEFWGLEDEWEDEDEDEDEDLDDDPDTEEVKDEQPRFGQFKWTAKDVLEIVSKFANKADAARHYNIPVSTFKDWVYKAQKLIRD